MRSSWFRDVTIDELDFRDELVDEFSSITLKLLNLLLYASE